MITDKDRLDCLQSLLEEKGYSGKATLRRSTIGRGFILRETTAGHARASIREAIDDFIKKSQ